MTTMEMKAKRTEPPSGGLLNRAWPYVNAASTDVRARFDRIRAEQQAARAFATTTVVVPVQDVYGLPAPVTQGVGE